jgi:hypothetical protein
MIKRLQYFLYPKGGNDWRGRRRLRQALFCFIHFEGFEYKDIVILTRKRSQGIAIANYLTEQNI